MVKQTPEAAPYEPDHLLTIAEVARILSVSRSSIYWLIEHGELPSLHVGHALRFRSRDVHEYIEKRAARRPKGQRQNERDRARQKRKSHT